MSVAGRRHNKQCEHSAFFLTGSAGFKVRTLLLRLKDNLVCVWQLLMLLPASHQSEREIYFSQRKLRNQRSCQSRRIWMVFCLQLSSHSLDISQSVRTNIRTVFLTVFLEFASSPSGMFGHLYVQMCMAAGGKAAYCGWHTHTHTHRAVQWTAGTSTEPIKLINGALIWADIWFSWRTGL